MTQILEMIKKQKIDEHVKSLKLTLSCIDINGNDADTPIIKYYI